MNVLDAIAHTLKREGIEYLCTFPTTHIIESAAELGIRPIICRQERVGVGMADGYARTTGKPGVALVVPGPGIYNAGGGLSTAFSRSSPVVLIAGQIPRATIGQNLGGLHEVNDQKEITNPITKWQKQVLRPHEVPEGIHEAFRQAQSDRP